MSSLLSTLWPLSARMHPDRPGILQMNVGFSDWPEQVVVEEVAIADRHRQPWLALSRLYPRAPKILRAIAAVDLIPEAVSVVLERLPVLFAGCRDARRRVPGSQAHITTVRKRLNRCLRLMELFLPPEPTPTKARGAIVAHVEFKTDASPIHEPLIQELLKTIRLDVDIMRAMESDPATADTGRFLEWSLDRLRIKPVELACVLHHHPETLSALRRRPISDPFPVVAITKWIRTMVERSRKRPTKRPLTKMEWWSTAT